VGVGVGVGVRVVCVCCSIPLASTLEYINVPGWWHI